MQAKHTRSKTSMGLAQGNNDMRKMILEVRRKIEEEQALKKAVQTKKIELEAEIKELKRGKSALGNVSKRSGS